jgi:hypothetical protein
MWLAIVLILALISQVTLFLYSRKIKQELKDSVIEKYDLRTPKDAWEALGNPEIPDEDKKEIQKLYEGGK